MDVSPARKLETQNAAQMAAPRRTTGDDRRPAHGRVCLRQNGGTACPRSDPRLSPGLLACSRASVSDRSAYGPTLCSTPAGGPRYRDRLVDRHPDRMVVEEPRAPLLLV